MAKTKVHFPQYFIHYSYGNNFSERSLSKIDKRKQTSLEQLNISDCRISGKYLFDLNENLGWENLN